jgi:hypothetical protein
MLIKVEGTNFVKDTETNALLMTGRDALAQNEARKRLLAKTNARNEDINNLKSQVDNLSSDMQEIKLLLTEMLKTSKK